MKSQTQKERILKLLRDNPAGINSYGIARDLALQLPTRIFELRGMGHNITSIAKQDKSIVNDLVESTRKVTREFDSAEFPDMF